MVGSFSELFLYKIFSQNLHNMQEFSFSLLSKYLLILTSLILWNYSSGRSVLKSLILIFEPFAAHYSMGQLRVNWSDANISRRVLAMQLQHITQPQLISLYGLRITSKQIGHSPFYEFDNFKSLFLIYSKIVILAVIPISLL